MPDNPIDKIRKKLEKEEEKKGTRGRRFFMTLPISDRSVTVEQYLKSIKDVSDVLRTGVKYYILKNNYEGASKDLKACIHILEVLLEDMKKGRILY